MYEIHLLSPNGHAIIKTKSEKIFKFFINNTNEWRARRTKNKIEEMNKRIDKTLNRLHHMFRHKPDETPIEDIYNKLIESPHKIPRNNYPK